MHVLIQSYTIWFEINYFYVSKVVECHNNWELFYLDLLYAHMALLVLMPIIFDIFHNSKALDYKLTCVFTLN